MERKRHPGRDHITGDSMDSRAGTIVVGLDDSASSRRALAWAAEQAVADHRELTLVHTISAVTSAYLDAAAMDHRKARESLRAQAEAVFAAARREIARKAPQVVVHEVFSFEDPREQLLELSGHAALVVVGSRGRGQVRSLLLGSVGVALVRHSACPVIIHRPGNPGTVRNGIVVGADGSEESRTVLEFAYQQAAVRRLPLTVLHCYADGRAAMGYLVTDPFADLESEKLLLAESMAGLAEKHPDVRAQTQLADGLPQEELVRMGERMNLVVVGAHQSGSVKRMLFGSVAIAVTEHVTCPVAVVPLARVE
jgi:nucleotide-binding universal stress UspA family protein